MSSNFKVDCSPCVLSTAWFKSELHTEWKTLHHSSVNMQSCLFWCEKARTVYYGEKLRWEVDFWQLRFLGSSGTLLWLGALPPWKKNVVKQQCAVLSTQSDLWRNEVAIQAKDSKRRASEHVLSGDDQDVWDCASELITNSIFLGALVVPLLQPALILTTHHFLIIWDYETMLIKHCTILSFQCRIKLALSL